MSGARSCVHASTPGAAQPSMWARNQLAYPELSQAMPSWLLSRWCGSLPVTVIGPSKSEQS